MDLERAIEIAVVAHKGMKDKGGDPYILHPLRMMMAVETNDEKIIAVLHDVVEDTDWTFDRLKEEGLSDNLLEALRSVTKLTENENYESFIERALTNPIGRKVKIADIKDNLDIKRIGLLKPKDMDRINKYKKALEKLTQGQV